MLNGTVLDVAIGLIFIFLMLSVACSLLNERVQSFLDQRARTLEEALRKLLGGKNASLFSGVKNHALVQTIGHSPSGMPSYLPASTFSAALFDALMAPKDPADSTAAAKAKAAAANAVVAKVAAANAVAANDAAASAAASAAENAAAAAAAASAAGAMVPGAPAVPDGAPPAGNPPVVVSPAPAADVSMPPPLTFAQLYAAIAALEEPAPDGPDPVGWFKRLVTRIRPADANPPMVPTARAALLALMNTAKGDLEIARGKIEHWFDGSMERASGAYKRRISVWLFVLGFVLAAVTNADAIQLVQRLEHEGALRATVSAQADHIAHAASADAVPFDRSQLEQMDLLFWEMPPCAQKDLATHPRAMYAFSPSPEWLGWFLLKLAGFAMTALAVSLGAPFWFDLLGRLVNLRATGAKPAPPPQPSTAATKEPTS